MRFHRIMPLLLLLIPALFSCNKELNVNADWKDVTVVYGLLDQTDDTAFIKITKAFLGEGDALVFSKEADSSNYPDKLEVRLDEFLVSSNNDSTLIQSYSCDTVTIHDKKKGDSIFYYPDQLMYYTTAKLDQKYIYKLHIKNKLTGKVISAQTALVHDFEIFKPMSVASFPPGKMFEVKWNPAKKGKRYQLLIRFYYYESLKSNHDSLYLRSIDWLVFNNIKAIDDQSTLPYDLYYPGDAFYSAVGANIKPDTLVDHRVAHHCYFIFTVAASDLNTYMEVTEPSLSLVQEKPSYTNVVNGIGLFSSRFIKSSDSLDISQITKDELKVNANTQNRGF